MRCSSTSRSPTSTPSCARKSGWRSASSRKPLGLTTVMVTHDQDEALAMADRLVVMAGGVIQQIGTQRDSTSTRPTASSPASSGGRTSCAGRLVEPGVFRSDGGLTSAVTATRRDRRRSVGADQRRPGPGVPSPCARAPDPGAVRDPAAATTSPGRSSLPRTWGPSSSTTCGSVQGRRCACTRPTPAPLATGSSRRARRCTCRWPVEVGLVLEHDHHHEEDQR